MTFYHLLSEDILHHFCNALLVTQVSPLQYGREFHNGLNLGRQEVTGALVEASYHIPMSRDAGLNSAVTKEMQIKIMKYRFFNF